MTPSEIEVLIHCHVSPAEHPRSHASAVQQALQSLNMAGLIDRLHRTTKRGQAHVEQLCRLTWPVAVWIGADGKKIDV